MTDAERIAHLEAELASLHAYVRELLAENAALKRRLAQDSHTSSKPPASDGLARRPRPTRRKSGKKPGGQPGHVGQTLAQVASPDVVTAHRPAVCEQCQQALDGVPGVVVERRQVQDLPPLRLEVTEHQAVAVRCPTCRAVTRGSFPDTVRAPAQYGPRLRALAVYLPHYQVVPQERTHEALADLFGCTLRATGAWQRGSPRRPISWRRRSPTSPSWSRPVRTSMPTRRASASAARSTGCMSTAPAASRLWRGIPSAASCQARPGGDRGDWQLAALPGAGDA